VVDEIIKANQISVMKCPPLLSALALFAMVSGITDALAVPPSAKAIKEFADDYLARREATGFRKQLSMPEALLVQRGFLKHLQPTLGKPVGYKVGLVTREMQERFKVETPVRGVLLEKMLLYSGDPIEPNFAVRPLLEADLLVVVGHKDINNAQSIMEVAENLKEVVAFIELPDSFLATNPPPTGALLTAGNVGARLGIMGKRLPARPSAQFVKSMADMTATMVDDRGTVLGRGKGSVILDHPLNSVLWLIEELHRSGERLKAGDLISLGSIMTIPAPVGKSVTVRYDGLLGGVLDVSVNLP
jgi:2-keto-4-pentenoate hydratase